MNGLLFDRRLWLLRIATTRGRISFHGIDTTRMQSSFAQPTRQGGKPFAIVGFIVINGSLSYVYLGTKEIDKGFHVSLKFIVSQVLVAVGIGQIESLTARVEKGHLCLVQIHVTRTTILKVTNFQLVGTTKVALRPLQGIPAKIRLRASVATIGVL